MKGLKERKDKMRSDYVLYAIAVLCFIIAGVFLANIIPLATPDVNLAATAVLLILGILLAIGGYGLRPKAAAPMPMMARPTTTEPSPPPPMPPVEEKVEETPAIPTPVVETPPEVTELPAIEPTVPPAEATMSTEPVPVLTLEEPAKCPRCGTVVSSPKKKWTMAGRPDKSGKKTQLEIGLYDCPKDHKPFRVVLKQEKI